MELMPAIDLRGGEAVRLTQGDFAREARTATRSRWPPATSTPAPPGFTWSTSTRRGPACPTSAAR